MCDGILSKILGPSFKLFSSSYVYFFFFSFFVSGAASDMEFSNRIANAMVSMYGMSDKVL